MAQSRKVRISNSTLNQYGTRILTEGVDLEQFKKNPILLWMHSRAWGGRKDDVLPIGRVENIQIEGDDITGELVFDAKDEFAMKLAQKWDDGILKMVSPNLDIIAIDDSQELALPGQTRATITKSKLIELSVVDIGGNDANMVLYKDGKQLKLSEGGDGLDIPLLSINSNNKKEENKMDFKTIALKLGLPETATETDICNKIGILLAYQTANETLRQEKEQLQLAGITQVVEAAIAERKILADKKEHFINLGKTAGIESLNITLAAISPVAKPTNIIGGGANGASGSISLGAEKWKTLRDVPADKLQELKDNDQPTYIRLYEAEYGIKCII